MSRIDDFINQNDDLDIKGIIEKYENKTITSKIENDEIWSEPLEESFGSRKSQNKNNNTKPFNIDLNSDFDDLPKDYLKNNQTIKLNNSEKVNKINLWDQNELKNKWDKFDGSLNDTNNLEAANILLTSEFQPKKSTRKLQTIKLEQPDLSYESLEDTNNYRNEFNKRFASAQSMESKKEINNATNENKEKQTTKILFDDSTTNLPRPELTKELNDAENITIKSKKPISSKKIAKMKQKELRAEQYRQVPKFFKFEYKNSIVCLSISSILLTGALGLLSYIAIQATMGILDFWLLLPVAICVLVFGCIFTKSTLDYTYLKKDLLNSNFQIDNTTPMVSIRKMYKKLLGANISLNWISLASYVICGLGVLLTYIVTYFMNLTGLAFNDFTRLIIGADNYLPVIFVWTFVGISGFIFIIQLVFNFINRKRRSEIELFYKQPIFDEQEVARIKKNANIKGGIIFSFSLLVVGFVVLMVYFILKKKKA